MVAAMACGRDRRHPELRGRRRRQPPQRRQLRVAQPPSANHRQLWFNTQLPEGGPFTDPRVRQAVGYAVDRQQIVDTCSRAQAIIANDHPVYPTLPFFDDDAGAAAPRRRDGQAAACPTPATPTGSSRRCRSATSPRSLVWPRSSSRTWPRSASRHRSVSHRTPTSTASTGAPAPSGAPSPRPVAPVGRAVHRPTLGIVDYGHRPTPDIYFGRALADRR